MSTDLPTLTQFKQAFSSFGVVVSQALENVMEELLPAVSHNIPILLLGPSGSGKTALAETVHKLSRQQRKFIDCNCAALPSGLVESELFGHVKGAFTGAGQDKVGVFGQAGGGTLFLDEIGELELPAQAKLLQVLNNGGYRRVGDTEIRLFSGRIITATNKDLSAEVGSKNFRADLYYRIARRVVCLPSLAEQPEAVWPTFQFCVDKYLCKYGSGSPKPVYKDSDGIKSVLLQHYWPGNFRELDICAENVVLDVLYSNAPIAPEVVRRFMDVGGEQAVALATIEQVERQQIERALALCNGVVSHAARKLGISPQTLARKVAHLRIDLDRFQSLPHSKLEILNAV